MAKSTRTKPKKPYPSFPLTPHNNGQWCKKIRGKIHFFGTWEDPHAALKRYLRVAEDLHAGRSAHKNTLLSEEITVKDICNHYLTYQREKVESGEISARSFEDCRRVLQYFARFVGASRIANDLVPEDFRQLRHRLTKRGLTSSGRGLGVHALQRTVTIIKGAFKHAYDQNLVDQPVRFGKAFEKPSAKSFRQARRITELENGKRLFEPFEILAVLDASKVPLRAMILLGINGGLGNTDCARLPITALHWDREILEFHRPKTAIERVIPLWPETVDALRETLVARPKPADNKAAKLVFLSTFGHPWVRDNFRRVDDTNIEKIVTIDAIQKKFDKLLRKLGLKRKGLGFYALRHTFRTWADETRDQHAIHRIMGHAIPGMSGIYVEEISLNRLRAVTEHVRAKLFGDCRESR